MQSPEALLSTPITMEVLYAFGPLSISVAADERRQHVFCCPYSFKVMKHMNVALLASQQIVMYEQKVQMLLMAFSFLKEVE
jgi:hypothetical protein